MAKTATPQTSLVDLLNKASASDLADIDQQIAAKQTELDEATKKIGGQLDSLKAIRKVLDLRINGKPARKKREPKSSPVNRLPSVNGNGHGRAVDRDAAGITVQSVAEILKSCGPCSPYTIAKKLGPPATDYLVRTFLMQHKDKFMSEGTTWDLIE